MRDKGGKAPGAAAGEKRSKRKEDPAPEPVKKPRINEALRKNPTAPRRATKQEKGKGKAVEEEAHKDMIPFSRIKKGITIREPTAQPERPSLARPTTEGESTAARPGNETTPVNQSGAVEPTATGLEEERETVITEETIGGIDVTVESYKEHSVEVPIATTAEASNETERVEAVITNLPIPQASPHSPKTPIVTGTPAETLTLASDKSDKTIFDEEEDEEEKRFREEQAQLLAAMQQL
ncbi:uncharacterized protein LOC127244459 [Andrographis paniculata]|uniref:uncharacterized protein LOC127244459 n=1 Tax=Andrographis paniculata TaxID=175694 RepID=UPI0021E85245|nr:uncharacterized protein LOC127244459 [Andrographis paniculata]